MYANRFFYTLILASLLLSSCMTETSKYLASVPTDITLYSEFSTEDGMLHQKMYDYFNLECPDGSSMSVITPLHLDVEKVNKKNVIDNSTQYKIVIGNNISGNTIYYSSPETEKLAGDISTILNEFLANYD